MSTSAQIGTSWSPSPKQAAFLEAATECGFDRNISTIARAAGVPRRTVYNWLDNDPGFKDAWENLWKKTLSRHVPGVVAALVKRAQRGDVPAAKVVLDLAGFLGPDVKARDEPALDYEKVVNQAMNMTADEARQILRSSGSG